MECWQQALELGSRMPGPPAPLGSVVRKISLSLSLSTYIILYIYIYIHIHVCICIYVSLSLSLSLSISLSLYLSLSLSLYIYIYTYIIACFVFCHHRKHRDFDWSVYSYALRGNPPPIHQLLLESNPVKSRFFVCGWAEQIRQECS